MRYHILIVADSRIRPQLLTDAVGDAWVRAADAVTLVDVILPVVVPPTLPIAGWPPRLAARLGRLEDAARAAMELSGIRGRVEIVPCRSVAALLQAVWPVDTLILVGGAGWSVRRAARGVAPNLVVIPSRATVPRHGAATSAQRKALPE